MIIVPYSFVGGKSKYALEESYNLAKLSNSEITLVCVIEKNLIFDMLKTKDMLNEFEHAIKDDIQKIAKEGSEKSGVKIHTSVRKGRIYSEILKEATEKDAKHIVVGLNASEDSEQKYIGANTLKLIKNSKIPVITVSGCADHNDYKNILLPIDATKETAQKVKETIKIGKVFGSKIHIVTTDSGLNFKVNIFLKQCSKSIRKHGLKCSTKVLKVKNSKKPAPEIVEYAKENGMNLIVIMSQKEDSTLKYHLSSNSQDFIRDTDVPVMTIKPKNIGITRYVVNN